MKEVLFHWASVESISDDADGRRIKARMQSDGKALTKDLPFAFPLLPKFFNCMPQIGECVLICTAQIGNKESQRYYIGPIISQFQETKKSPYSMGYGKATSLLDGSRSKPHERLSDFADTEGAFPDKNDVALIGKEDSDIIIKESEIDLRCGVRKMGYGLDNPNLTGPVIFNSEDPAYIQMKYSPFTLNDGKSVTNIVSDKINLISYRDKDKYNNASLTHENSKIGDKTEPLMKDDDINSLMDQLHTIPYGDILLQILTKMMNIFQMHNHNWGQETPCQSEELKNEINDVYHLFTKLESKNVKIS